MMKLEVNWVTKHWGRELLMLLPAEQSMVRISVKVYISKVGGGVSDHALILLMKGGWGGLRLSKTYLCNIDSII